MDTLSQHHYVFLTKTITVVGHVHKFSKNINYKSEHTIPCNEKLSQFGCFNWCPVEMQLGFLSGCFMSYNAIFFGHILCNTSCKETVLVHYQCCV
jgi:hypothetical protein